MAFTFAQIALQAKDNPERRKRNTRNARAAYDTVLRLAACAAMDDTRFAELRNSMIALRSMLTALCEPGL